MSFDWGSVIGAAASLYGAKKGADASKAAGNQAAAGATASNDLLKEFYNRDEARNQPAYQNGLTAQAQYMRMLGLTPYGQSGGGTPGAATATSATPNHWFNLQNGVPVADQQMYGSDPRYHAAWDQATAEHANSHAGGGYTGTSDQGVIGTRLAQLYGQNPGVVGPSAGGQASGDPYAQFRNTPGYQFGLDEGNKAVQASAAARGGLNSGATLKELMGYGVNYADKQGFDPYMQRLANVAGMGQTATGAMGSAGQSYGSAMSGNLQNAANARAQSTYGVGNAWQQGLGGAAYFGGKAYDNYRNKQGGGG